MYSLYHVICLYLSLWHLLTELSLNCRMLENQLREDEFKADSFGGKRHPASGFEKSKMPSLTKPHLTSYLQ